MNKLILGDAIERMRELPSGVVDAVICDPPYGTTACKWDSVIPFEPIWREIWRLVKANAAVVLFGSEPFSTQLRASELKRFKYDWIWEKDNVTGFLTAKKRPLKAHENISVFYSKQPTYNPQGIIRRPKVRKNTGHKNPSSGGLNSYGEGQFGAMRTATWTQEFTNYPRSIVFGPVPRKTCHPTQKPIELLEYLVATYTNPGDIVLDFAMGSGTTGVACKNLGRLFIGIEKDASYFELAKKRIEQTPTPLAPTPGEPEVNA